MQKILLFIILLLVCFGSQAQLKKFMIEVPNPPKFKISDSIQSFTIMNRSMNSEFVSYNEKALQLDFYRKNFITNTILLDSTAADTTIKVLGDLLFESLRYDVVIPTDRNIYRLLSFTETPAPLDWEYVNLICETYNTDALLVLENIAIRTVTNYKNWIENEGFYFTKHHYASMDFYSRAHWRIYDPKTEKITVDLIMNQDTIYWDNTSNEIVELFKGLPSIKEATFATGVKLATNFVKIIAPTWTPESRYYYVMRDTLIDKSIQLAADGEWGMALENWLQYSEQGKRSERSKIMLNIALGFEMTGDIDNAIDWVQKAQKLYYREVVNYYLKELLKRQLLLKN